MVGITFYAISKDWQDHREGIVWAMKELGQMQMWYSDCVRLVFLNE